MTEATEHVLLSNSNQCPKCCTTDAEEFTATDGKGFAYDFWQCIYDDCRAAYQHEIVDGRHRMTQIERPRPHHILGRAK